MSATFDKFVVEFKGKNGQFLVRLLGIPERNANERIAFSVDVTQRQFIEDAIREKLERATGGEK